MNKPLCCPICCTGNVQPAPPRDADDAKPGEEMGAVRDDSITGCFDWTDVIVRWLCPSGHSFYTSVKT